MASRQLSAKKPKDLGHTLRTLLSYLGRHKLLFLAVAVLVALSALANLLGTYMIRPVVNSLAAGSLNTLVLGVAVTAAIYGAGVLSALGYTQIMVKAAQKVLYDIRRDLFAHIQTLPLRFFDTQRHGDVMSYFTNDVDTISEALNNSFAMLIQSTIQVAGTFTMLFLLDWQLTLVVAVFYVLMFLYVRFSGRRSKAYYKKQQDCLGELDGYIEEMMAGQKVVKVFNHEEESLRAFREKNEALRKAGTGAQSYAATMIPAVVSISYVNYALVAVLGGIMALKGMTDALGIGDFVRQAVSLNEGLVRFVPLLIFCIAIFIAFSSGTSWGTFAILVPIVVNMFSETDPTMMIVAVSAVLAGAVCGDHISPISDTTIMSSSGAQSNHINHVQTQMQYAMVVVAACVPGYLIAGFTENWLITLVSSLAILTAALLYLRRRSLAEDVRA